MKIYLAGPINGCTDDEAHTWRDVVKEKFGEDVCLDPMRRDYRGVEMQHIEDIVFSDLEDIAASEIILANCWQASAGTSMELWQAYLDGKYIIVIGEPGVRMSPWVYYVADDIVEYVEDAFPLIEAVMLETADVD